MELNGNRIMKKLIIPATKEATANVIKTIEKECVNLRCSVKKQMQLSIVLEELLINIVHYAYQPENNGDIQIQYEFFQVDKGIRFNLICIDKGKEYNLLEKEEPDITLSTEERSIGGLGIFIIKKLVDFIAYERNDGENRIQIKKDLF